MDVLRKFGVWVAAAVLVIGAIAAYFVAVPGLAKQRKEKWGVLEHNRDGLGGWAKNPSSIPNDAKINEENRVGKQVTLQLNDCDKFLGRQPRRCQTRSFFEDEKAETGVEIRPERSGAWLEAYAKNNDALKRQLADAGFGAAFAVQTMDSVWGTAPPKPDEITAAMEFFWFQKDLADFLTEQVEKDFAAYLTLKATGRPERFPAKPSDLVINRNPGRLGELLRAKSRKQLAAILSAIVYNTEQHDLATIFNTFLPDEGGGEPTTENGFPWTRKEGVEKPSVLGLTMDEAQKNFLAEMLPPDKEDLADRQRFINFIMELRTVRYREDVFGLLESQKDFEDLAKSLKKGTEEEYARVLADFGKEDLWSRSKLADAIAAVVSIKDDKDYLLVRNNHSQNIMGVETVSIGHGEAAATPVAGGRPGAAVAAAGNQLYVAHSFNMRLKVEFKRIPVMLRRLLSNSWRYSVDFSLVAPISGSGGAEGERPMPGGAMPGGGMPGAPMPGGGMPGAPMPGGAMPPSRMPSGGVQNPATGPTPATPPGAETEIVEPGHYVWVALQGEGYQFTPLLAKVGERTAGAAAPSVPPGNTAAPAAPPHTAPPPRSAPQGGPPR